MVGRKNGNEDKGNVNLVTRRPFGVSAVMVIPPSIPTPETGVVGETPKSLLLGITHSLSSHSMTLPESLRD